MPSEDFIYIGDTARTPYGPRSEKEVRLFVEEMLSFLEKQGVKLVVVACNTLTVLGIDTLKGSHNFAMIGMSKGEKLVLQTSKNKKIGIMATEFTIKSGVHKAAILAEDPQAEVYPRACPKYVPLIEGEKFGSADIKSAVAESAAPLKSAGVDTIILSCTHYPFIRQDIQVEVGDQVTIIDPADETSMNAQVTLKKENLLNDTNKPSKIKVCFTADVERGKRIASRVKIGRASCRERVYVLV